MKHFRIRKNAVRRKAMIMEIRPHLQKPKIPLVMFWKVHDNDNVYLGWK
jgi:hypothetical protein